MKMIRLLTILLVALFMVAGTTIKRGPGGGGSGEDVITLADPGTDEAVYTFDDITKKLTESLVTITPEGTVVQPDQSSIGGNVISVDEHEHPGQAVACSDQDPDQFHVLDVEGADGTIEPGMCIGTTEAARFTSEGLDLGAGRLSAEGGFSSLNSTSGYPPESKTQNRNAALIETGRSQQAVTPPDGLFRKFQQYRHMPGDGLSTGGAWPPDGNGAESTSKTKVGHVDQRLVKHGGGEWHAVQVTAENYGPGDAVNMNRRWYVGAGGEVMGDEGPMDHRLFPHDYHMASGSITEDMSATDTSIAVTLDNLKDWDYIGEQCLVVFTDPDVGALLTGTGADGVTGYASANGTWTVQNSGQLPADPKDYAFALDSTAFDDQDAATQYGWIRGWAGPGESGCGGTCAADEFETAWFTEGTRLGAPYAYIPGQRGTPVVSGENGRMAPMEVVTDFAPAGWDDESGQATSASGTISIEAARNSVTSVDGSFVVSCGPARKMQSHRTVFDQRRGRSTNFGIREFKVSVGDSGVTREVPYEEHVHCGGSPCETDTGFVANIVKRWENIRFGHEMHFDDVFSGSLAAGTPSPTVLRLNATTYTDGDFVPFGFQRNADNSEIYGYGIDYGATGGPAFAFSLDGVLEPLLVDPEAEDIGAANIAQDHYEDGSTNPGTVRAALDGIDDKLGHMPIIRQSFSNTVVSDSQCIRTDRNNVGTATCNNANTWTVVHKAGEIPGLSAAILANIPADVACAVGISLNQSTGDPAEVVSLAEQGVATTAGTVRNLTLSTPIVVSPGDTIGFQFINDDDICEAGAGSCGTCNGVSNTETLSIGAAVYIQ